MRCLLCIALYCIAFYVLIAFNALYFKHCLLSITLHAFCPLCIAPCTALYEFPSMHCLLLHCLPFIDCLQCTWPLLHCLPYIDCLLRTALYNIDRRQWRVSAS